MNSKVRVVQRNQERGIYLAMTALALTAVMAVFLFFGHDSVSVRKYETEIQKSIDDICFGVASGSTPMLQRQVLRKFQGAINRTVTDRDAGKILANVKIIDAQLVLPLEYGVSKRSDAAREFKDGMGEPKCNLDGGSDCKVWTNPDAKYLQDNYPAKYWYGTDGLLLGSRVGCEITTEFQAPISGKHTLTVRAIEELPVRSSGAGFDTYFYGITMMIAPEMSTTYTDQRFWHQISMNGNFTSGDTWSDHMLMGVDTQVYTTNANYDPFRLPSGATRYPRYLGGSPANATFMGSGPANRDLTRTPAEMLKDESNQNPNAIFGQIIPSFPGLELNQRREMAIACNNPAILVRNLFAQSIMELAVRQGDYGLYSEVAIVNPENDDGSRNKPTVVVPRFGRTHESIYQLPFVFYRQGDAISPFVDPFATNPLLGQAYQQGVSEDGYASQEQSYFNQYNAIPGSISMLQGNISFWQSEVTNITILLNSAKVSLALEMAKPPAPAVPPIGRDLTLIANLNTTITIYQQQISDRQSWISSANSNIQSLLASQPGLWSAYQNYKTLKEQAQQNKFSFLNRYNYQYFQANQLRYCAHMYSGKGQVNQFKNQSDSTGTAGWDFSPSSRDSDLRGKIYRMPAYGVANWDPASAAPSASLAPFMLTNVGYESDRYQARTQLDDYPTTPNWATTNNPWDYLDPLYGSWPTDKRLSTASEIMGMIGSIQRCPFPDGATPENNLGCVKDPAATELTGDWRSAVHYMKDKVSANDRSSAIAPPGLFGFDLWGNGTLRTPIDNDWPFDKGSSYIKDPYKSDIRSIDTRYVKEGFNENVLFAILHRPPEPKNACEIRQYVYEMKCGKSANRNMRNVLVAYFPTTKADATGASLQAVYDAFDISKALAGCKLESDPPVSACGMSRQALEFAPPIYVFSPYSDKNCSSRFKFGGPLEECGPTTESGQFNNYWRYLLDFDENQTGNIVSQAKRIFLMKLLSRNRMM